MAGMVSGAAAGTAILPGAGTVIGGILGLGAGLIEGFAQREQDKRELKRGNESFALQLGQAEALAEIELAGISRTTDATTGINTAQASRYSARQHLHATQTEEANVRQSTIMGMQAQAQNAQANQQFIGMNLSRSQEVGQSQQQAALSGLRGTGSVRSAQTMQENLYDRTIDSAQTQLERGRASISSQLAHGKITATQAAEKLRVQGTERMTAAEEANSLLRLNADIAKTTVEQRLQGVRDTVRQETAWNEEDLDWLDSAWGITVTLSSALF